MTNPSFQIFTDKTIREDLSKNEFLELLPPFFLLVKSGEMIVKGDIEKRIESTTISAFAKEKVIHVISLSEDCECILFQFNRIYIRTLTLRLDLLDAFKYVYSNPQLTFDLPKNDFNDLWFLAKYTSQQLNNSKNSAIEKHILRHLNYSFLYSCIEKMNRTHSFEANPRNQQEKLVLSFLKNLQNNSSSKLKVSDYAEMQHVTTRHLSTTVKKVTGMPALDIIHRLHLSHAKTELTETDKPISEIAFELGYTDPYTFSHFFKKLSGFSPSDFRTNYQG
ncbi:MAG: helix-turn-helix domain-containing protein [Lutibacter sp.]